MLDENLHPTISAKYETKKGFVQKLGIPGLGYRDLAVTPLWVVQSAIDKGIIPGLVEKVSGASEVEITVTKSETKQPKSTPSKKNFSKKSK